MALSNSHHLPLTQQSQQQSACMYSLSQSVYQKRLQETPAFLKNPKKGLFHIGYLARLIVHQLFRIADFVSALSVLDLGGFVSLLERR